MARWRPTSHHEAPAIAESLSRSDGVPVGQDVPSLARRLVGALGPARAEGGRHMGQFAFGHSLDQICRTNVEAEKVKQDRFAWRISARSSKLPSKPKQLEPI